MNAGLHKAGYEGTNGDVQPPPKAVGWNNGLGGNSFDSLQERLEFYQSDFARLDAE